MNSKENLTFSKASQTLHNEMNYIHFLAFEFLKIEEAVENFEIFK